MKKATLLTFCLLTIFASCKKINLAGYNESKTFTINDFSKIEAHNDIHVSFCDSIDHIVATTDANALPHLKVDKQGQTLKFSYPSGILVNFSTEILVPFRNGLNKVTLSGSSSFVSAKSIETDNLEMDLSGASSVTGDFIISNGKLDIDASGASTLALRGFAKSVDVDFSGASKITASKADDGYAFACDELDGDLSGGSSIQIHCNDMIDCDLSGSSTIHYTGNADTSHCKCSGGSNVVHEN